MEAEFLRWGCNWLIRPFLILLRIDAGRRRTLTNEDVINVLVVCVKIRISWEDCPCLIGKYIAINLLLTLVIGNIASVESDDISHSCNMREFLYRLVWKYLACDISIRELPPTNYLCTILMQGIIYYLEGAEQLVFLIRSRSINDNSIIVLEVCLCHSCIC